jgi:hypothetical protein
MVMIKKVGTNQYKLIAKTHSGTPHRGRDCKNKTYRSWWSVKARGDSLKGTLTIGTISIPKELVGKKVEMYLKVIGEKIIYGILDDFEAKNKITEIILLGKNGGIRRISIGEEENERT